MGEGQFVFDNQNPEKLNLIIVHSKDTSKYANLLNMMINNKDDESDSIVGVKDGSVTTAVWNEKHYIDNKPTIKGGEYIIFIGNSKIINQETFGVSPIFNKFGMEYSYLGTKAKLNVKEAVAKKEYKEFFEFAKQYQEKVEDIFKDGSWSLHESADFKETAVQISKKVLELQIWPYYFVGDKIMKNVRAHIQLIEQEYSCLIYYFYKVKLRKFLGQQDN